MLFHILSGLSFPRLVSGHLGEGLLELLSDGLVLLLLSHQLVLQPVHLEEEEEHGHWTGE